MRYDDWQTRYYAAILAVHAKPFQWGEHDCITFACYVADTITDRKTRQAIRDLGYEWRTKEEADAIVTAAGGLQVLISKVLGDPVPPLLCSIGDVVLASNGTGGLITTVHDGHYLLAPEPTGLTSKHLRTAVMGWKV